MFHSARKPKIKNKLFNNERGTKISVSELLKSGMNFLYPQTCAHDLM